MSSRCRLYKPLDYAYFNQQPIWWRLPSISHKKNTLKKMPTKLFQTQKKKNIHRLGGTGANKYGWKWNTAHRSHQMNPHEFWRITDTRNYVQLIWLLAILFKSYECTRSTCIWIRHQSHKIKNLTVFYHLSLWLSHQWN